MLKLWNAQGTCWKIQNNAAVHGLEFAADQHKAECKREQKPSNFDTFYFALFGKWPTHGRKAGK